VNVMLWQDIIVSAEFSKKIGKQVETPNNL
jgi:hypothetical protein